MKNHNSSSSPLAVITGASQGIGLELAKLFAKNNFNLLIISDTNEIELAAETLRNLGAQVETLKLDLTDMNNVEKVKEKILKMNQPINSLVLNAGLGISGEFVHTDWQQELCCIQLNVISLTYLTKILLPIFLQQGYGRILFTSSILSESPGPYFAIYSASKAFVHSFAGAIRYELKNTEITVTSFQPGATDTEFFDKAELQNSLNGKFPKDDPAQVAEDGFNALMSGKANVIAGSLKSKLIGVGTKVLPNRVMAVVQGKLLNPFFKDEK
ncbi:MAG: SDR family NAD(P)-dependent oxidoreductase [Pseudomonadota bacterium]